MLNYKNLTYWDQKTVSETVFNKLIALVNECENYEQIKTRLPRLQVKGAAKKIVLATLAETERRGKSLVSDHKNFVKVVNQVRKNIVSVDKIETSLTHYFWPVKGIVYKVTLSNGSYTIPATLPIDTLESFYLSQFEK